MDRFEFKTREDDAETTAVLDDSVHHTDLMWDLVYDPPEVDTTTEPDTATSAEADLTFDQMTEIARMMAPTPGIEGTDIGSGA